MKGKFQININLKTHKSVKYFYFFVIGILFMFSNISQSNARLNGFGQLTSGATGVTANTVDLTQISNDEVKTISIEIPPISKNNSSTKTKPYDFPPLPKETEQEVAILISQEPITKELIQKLKASFPEIQLRHKFEHVFHGISIKGPVEKLEEVEKYVTGLSNERLIENNESLDDLNRTTQPDLSIKRLIESENQHNIKENRQINPPIKRLIETENDRDSKQENRKGAQASLSIKRSIEQKSQHEADQSNQSAQNNLTEGTAQNNTFQLFPSYTYELKTNPSVQKQLISKNSINYIGTDAVRHIKDKNGNRLTGKGIKVGIIDTGIDYTHIDLRKSYVKGFDFIDNDLDPMETENLGPLSTFHGTHVAGVIAANGKMTGIAPDAEIYVYRALGPGGFGTTEMIIAAIEQAIKDQVDILNLSLGVSINGPDLPTSIALDKAVEKGIIAVTSNGNSGPEIWTVGSPGTSERAISVGASTPEIEIPYLEYAGQQFRLTPMIGSAPWNLNRSYKIVDGSLGKREDLANIPLDEKIVLIKRGEITFNEKVLNAKEQGAKAVLIYNNEEGEFFAQLETEVDIPAALLTKEEGEKLLQLSQQNQTFAKIIRKTEEDLLADFSSRGPVTYTWDIKPDLVAPGVAIESTVPGGYLTLQGTSMSAPHVAGAAALLKQVYPDFTPAQIKALLMNTSKLLQNEQAQTYQPYEQGAGRIDLVKALQSNSIVHPASLRLGKITGTKLVEKTKYVTVENISDEPVHYTFSTPPRSDEINWDLPLPFTLEPKQKMKVKIGMEVKDQHKQNDIYNGYLTMHANTQMIHIPYLYVVNEPDYPRIMAFSMETTKQKDEYEYEVYLPGGADEFGIALFDPDTFQFVEYLDWGRKIKRGTVTKKGKIKENIKPGIYIAVAFAKKEGREDYLDQLVEIGSLF